MNQPLSESAEREERKVNHDELLDEKAPGSPFLMVALSYMAVAAVACLAIAAYLYLA